MCFKNFYFSCLILCTGLVLAQNPIPNPGFENWTSGDPDGWETPNIFTLTPVTQSGDAHAGSSAVKLEVIDDDGSPYPPIINTNTIAISQNYVVFSYYAKTSLTGGDALVASIIMEKNGSPVSVNNFSLTANSSIYTQRSYTLSYIPPVSGVADELYVQLGIAGPMLLGTVGSYAIVDALSLSGNLVTGIQEEEAELKTLLGNPQPNPSSGMSLIPFSLTKSGRAVIELLTADGRMVKEILNEELDRGNYKAECSVSGLPSGLYFCQLRIDGRSAYTKLLVE